MKFKIFVDYYNSHEFEIPFESYNATDYIYTSDLTDKGVIVVAEWDSPVLPVKETTKKGEVGKEANITGINLGENQVAQHLRKGLTFAYTKVNNAEVIVKLEVLEEEVKLI